MSAYHTESVARAQTAGRHRSTTGVPQFWTSRHQFRSVVAAGILLSLLLGAGCRAGEPLLPVFDLVEELAFAEIRCEPTTVDLGTPQARTHLTRGWYHDEVGGRTGRSFVWSRGERSEVEFHLGRCRPISVTVTVSPFAAPGLPDQALRVLVNQHDVVRIPLRRGWHEYSFELSAEDLLRGANRLVFIPDHVWVPTEVRGESDDRRQLAVAVDTIRFDGTEDTAGVSAGDDRTISIPAGCSVDWFLDPPVGSELTLAGARLVGGADLALDLTLRRDLHADVPLESVRRTQGSVRLELPRGTGPIGLRFEAVTDGAAEPGRRVAIEAPRVEAPRQFPPTTLPEPAETGVDTRRPNVVLYLVDALRADHLGCYGSSRTASPRLDEFAAEATVFEDAVAQSSWTKAAVASIFTGVWPPSHGVHGPHDRLPDDLPTMPELLLNSGYRTAAVVANAYVGRSFGFDRGFEHFEFLRHTVGDSSVIHSRITRWMDRLTPVEPFFLYVHTVDPHAPYAPPDEFRQRFADHVGDPEVGGIATVRALARGERSASRQMADDLQALYEAEIAFNDFNFGRLVRELRERGIFDDSLIVFVSDHGEAFGEHGSWTHGLDLHAESLKIPLVIRFPGGRNAGLRVRHTVQQTDLLPTVLAAAGLTGHDDFDGEDLAPFVHRPMDRALFCYLDYWGRRGAAVLMDGWKLIRPLSEDFGIGAQLFDRESDPGERQNRAADMPIRTGFLDTHLRRSLARRRAPIRAEMDAHTRSELEALGYIE